MMDCSQLQGTYIEATSEGLFLRNIFLAFPPLFVAGRSSFISTPSKFEKSSNLGKNMKYVF